MRTWRPNGVNAIVTDPPYITDDAIELYSALADFALHVLPRGGVLAVMTDGPRLLDVGAAMRRPALMYRGVVCWSYGEFPHSRDWVRKTFPRWKPVLVFHKETVDGAKWLPMDVVVSESPNLGELHRWQQDVLGFASLVERISAPGDVVCDPFLGSGTTAVASVITGRGFIGADIDPKCIETTRKRLA